MRRALGAGTARSCGPGDNGPLPAPRADVPAEPSLAGLNGPGRLSDLARLSGLNATELRSEWRRLFRTEPPRLSPDLIRRAIAYRIQEAARGGLPNAVQRKLTALTADMAAGQRKPVRAEPRLAPGTRLVREWGGRTYTIAVTEAGFLFDGQPYRSLTEIARNITGAHWSGPRFFGLTKRRSDVATSEAEDWP